MSSVFKDGFCFVFCAFYLIHSVMLWDSVLLSWYLRHKQDDRFGDMTCLHAVNMSSYDNMPPSLPVEQTLQSFNWH